MSVCPSCTRSSYRPVGVALAAALTRTAVQYGFINYPNLSAHDAFLAPLQGEPAFMALMAELRPRWDAVVRWEAEMLTGQGSGQART